MLISKSIEIIETALLINKKILVINDLHLGYEEAMRNTGILVPRFQLQEIIRILQQILARCQPEKIIINGDLKHQFGKVLPQEEKEVSQFLDFLLKYSSEVIIIKGNHDPLIQPLARKNGVKVVTGYKIGDILVTHGDELVKTKAQWIIIGHEHPAIKIREKSKWEKYKCFLKGRWKGKELIVVPSFNPLIEGTDVLEGQALSPFLKKIDNFEAYIVSAGEVFKFGKIKKIK